MPNERRRFTGKEKLAILLEHLIEKEPISEVCQKHQIQPTMFSLTDWFSNNLIAKVEYPIQSGTNAGQPGTSSSDDVSYTYNLQGETATTQDQNGTVHTYSHDVLGRVTLDAVTTLGSGVDGTIRALGFNFTALGLPYQQTSYSNSSGTTVVNQVQDVYNGYGQLTAQYQEHSGAVNTSTSLNVQYVYSQPSGANYSRLSAMIYPNSRQLDYVYNSGLDSDISRVSAVADDGGTGAGDIQSYSYLGLSTIVQALDGNGIELTYIKQSGESNGDGGDQYIGLDRFGRVVDQRWIPTSSPTTPTDRFQYGYDRDGNVLYMNNLVSSTFSELYHANSTISLDDNAAYDNMNRLQAFSRGTLSASGNNGGGTGLDQVTTLNSLADSSQGYTLDALGNMTGTTTDGTAQSNTVNSQNEETAAGSNTLAFDNDGNTTTDDHGYTLVYDAWNRLVTVKNGSTTLASFSYDADGNRIQQTESSTTTDFYFSSGGQVLEERQGSTVANQYVWGLMGSNDLVLRDDNSTSGSGLGQRLYVQQDAIGNATALASTSGTAQERFIYTPYGTRTVLSSSWATASDSFNWVYGFQGGRIDPVSSLVHFGARDYSTSLYRWVQQDPAGYIDGGNRYAAMGDSPVTNVDPSGLCSDRDTGFSGAPGGGGDFGGPKHFHLFPSASDVDLDQLDDAIGGTPADTVQVVKGMTNTAIFDPNPSGLLGQPCIVCHGMSAGVRYGPSNYFGGAFPGGYGGLVTAQIIEDFTWTIGMDILGGVGGLVTSMGAAADAVVSGEVAAENAGAGGSIKNLSGPVEDAANTARSYPYDPDTVSTHALGRMNTRGVTYESIQEAVSNGARTFDPVTGKATYYLPASASSTGRAVQVVRNDITGNIVTVIDKGSK